MPLKGMLSFWRKGNGECLSPGILRGISRQQSRHQSGVLPHLLHRGRKPLIDGAIHEPVREPEHHDHGEEREQQAADHQSRTELGSEHAQAPLGEQLDEVATQNKSKSNKEQEYDRSEEHTSELQSLA